MADEWGVPEVNDAWVPDERVCPPVVRSVKAFMEDRVSQAERQSRNEDQRNIKGIFSKLSLHEDPKRKEANDRMRETQASSMGNQSHTLMGDDPSLPGMVDEVDLEIVSNEYMLQQSQSSFRSHGRDSL